MAILRKKVKYPRSEEFISELERFISIERERSKTCLSGVELHALRYGFSETTVISPKAKMYVLSLQSVYNEFSSAATYYLIHETCGFLSPTETVGVYENHKHKKFTSVELLKTLNKRVIFFQGAKKQIGGQEILEITKILIYVPKERDNVLHITDSIFCDETYLELAKNSELLVNYYQSGQLKTATPENQPLHGLEAFFFTNVKVDSSSFLIIYHP